MRWAAAAGLNLVLALALFAVGTPRFQFNDDPMMMGMVSGAGLASGPTALLPYTHVALGWLLRGLYAWRPGVPWYPLYLLLPVWLFLVVLARQALDRERLQLGLPMFLAFWLLVGSRLLLELQFTISSILATWTGGALLMLALQARGRVRWLQFGAGLLMVVFGVMVREAGGAIGALMFVPLLVLWTRTRAQRLRAVAALATAAALAATVSLLGHWLLERDPHAAGFRAWNAQTSVLIDGQALRRVDAAERARLLASVGWSELDQRVLQSWFLLDRERYALTRLQRLTSQLPAWNRQLAAATVLAELGAVLGDGYAQLCLLFAAGALVVLWRWRVLRVTALLVLLLDVAFFLALVLLHKPPPPRLFMPVFALLAALPLIGAGIPPQALERAHARTRLVGALGIWLLALALGAPGSLETDARYRLAQQAYRDTLTRWAPRPEVLYLSWTGGLGWTYLAPFGDLELLRPVHSIQTRLVPASRIALERQDLGDVLLALVERDDLGVIIQTPAESRVRLMKELLQRRLGQPVVAIRSFESIFFEVFTFRRAPVPSPASLPGPASLDVER